VGKLKHLGIPVKLSRTPGEIRTLSHPVMGSILWIFSKSLVTLMITSDIFVRLEP